MSEEGKNDHRTQKRWASQLTVATVVALLTLALAWSCIPMADWLDGATLWDWIGALKGGSRHWQYLARSRLTEDGLDYLLKAVILKPCAVRLEVCCQLLGPPEPVQRVRHVKVSLCVVGRERPREARR